MAVEDLGGEAARAWLEWIEKRMPGGRVVALVVAWLGVVVFAVWAFGFVYDNGVVRFGNWISGFKTTVDQWTAVAGVLVLGFAGMGVAQWLQYRRLRKWQLGLYQSLRGIIRPMQTSLEAIEQRGADVGSINEALSSLHTRLVAVEPAPLSFGTQEEGNRAALLRMLSGPRAESIEGRREAASRAPQFPHNTP